MKKETKNKLVACCVFLIGFCFVMSIGGVLFVFDCDEAPIKEYKYIIWVGSPAFGVGYETDTFNIDNGFVKYIDSKGNHKVHPINGVFEIEKKELIEKSKTLSKEGV